MRLSLVGRVGKVFCRLSGKDLLYLWDLVLLIV